MSDNRILPEGWIEAAPFKKIGPPVEIGWYALWNVAAPTDEICDVWTDCAYWNGHRWEHFIGTATGHAIGRSEEAFATEAEAEAFAGKFEGYMP